MDLKKISFRINHLHIDTSKIDKFIHLANTEFDEAAHKYENGLQTGKFDYSSLSNACKAGDVLFSIYALGILHCYSLLENNRKEVMASELHLLEKEIQSLHRIEDVKKTLREKIQIEHKTIKNEKVAEDFRLVNNAIKHSRFAFSQEVIIKGGGTIENRTYNAQKLRELYEKTPLLSEYLSDLYSKIKST